MTDVHIPVRLRKRPKYQGMIIPYTTWVHPLTHIPDFKINDERKRVLCVLRTRCAMCGVKMNKLYAFIGGPGSIEHSQLFVDAGMHPECAKYAWQVCPYIVYGKGHAAHHKEYEGAVIETFREIPTNAPERMGLGITDSFSVERYQGNLYVKVTKFLSVEWKHYPPLQAV